MTDICSYHIMHKQHSEIDTHNGIDQVEPVGLLYIKLMGQQILYLRDKPFQQQSSPSRKHTDYERQYQDELALAEQAAEEQQM